MVENVDLPRPEVPNDKKDHIPWKLLDWNPNLEVTLALICYYTHTYICSEKTVYFPLIGESIMGPYICSKWTVYLLLADYSFFIFRDRIFYAKRSYIFRERTIYLIYLVYLTPRTVYIQLYDRIFSGVKTVYFQPGVGWYPISTEKIFFN